MIKAKDLRIGNWIQHNGRFCKVNTIDGWELGLIEAGDSFGPASIYEYIPLTPELLERCGKHIEDLQDLLLIITNNAGGWMLGVKATGKKIAYVHQLQNLFYALTGEELNINL